ncbi:unnamed protein product, partial [marine sediment metagenome]
SVGGATLLQVVNLVQGTADGVEGMGVGLLLGFAAASISGYAAIAGLLEVLKRRGLVPFAWYCWAVGLLGLLVI